MENPLLAALLMVKDEARSVRATLDSARGAVDAWCVLDTGSVDSTCGIVDTFLQENPGGPGLFREGFVDYATTRNRLLDLHAGAPSPAKYALMLSADEVLCRGENLREFLAAYTGIEDVFLIEVRTPTGVFDYPRVMRTGSCWHYDGEIHEELRNREDPGRRPGVRVDKCWIEYRPSDPERFEKRLRERDLPLLIRQLASSRVAEQRGRLVILLAQTREQLAAMQGDPVTASQEIFSALGWYALAAMEDGIPDTVRLHATWKFLNVAEQVGIYTSHEMVARLRAVEQKDAKNPAVAYMLAAHTAKIDPRAGLQAAYKAARVAREAVVDSEHPHDPHGLLWRPHLVAAVCAKVLGHGPAVKKSVEAGLAAGGPRELFEQFQKEAS